MKLSLGCGSAPIHPGYLGVDVVLPADIIADLNMIWPWGDSSVDAVLAVDVIEHLPEAVSTMNELWRVLKPGGIAEIEVPTTDGPGAFSDPTHRSHWNRGTFDYFIEGATLRSRYATSYGISARFSVVQEYLRTMREGPKLLIKLKAIK